MTVSAKQVAHAMGFKASTLANSEFSLTPPIVVDGELQLASQTCAPVTAALTVGATAYFVYLGKTARKVTASKVLFNVTVAGASTQVGEVGLFSSPVAPNRAAQTLTKLVATGTLDALTGTGIKGNTTAFSYDVPAGTHLWAGYRVDMASTEPTVVGLGGDESMGAILALASATAFTSGTTYAGALITAALTWQCPNLVLTVT